MKHMRAEGVELVFSLFFVSTPPPGCADLLVLPEGNVHALRQAARCYGGRDLLTECEQGAPDQGTLHWRRLAVLLKMMSVCSDTWGSPKSMCAYHYPSLALAQSAPRGLSQ